MESLQSAIEAVTTLLDPAEYTTDPDQLYVASMDNLRYSRMPSLRIFPKDEGSIAAVMRIANQYKVPLTVRGAGSATTGTTTPAEKGWVLDLSGWDNLHVDPVARMAFVQPGVTLGKLDEAAAEHGLAYPPDPGSKAYSTIGGTIATNAGGMRGAKYGVTRDYVISLEGFLPTGEFVRWGSNLRKFSAGFNLRDLWIGAEGSLGIITGAVLKLLPKPPAQATCLAVFDTAHSALSCSQEILRSGNTPSAMEFLDTQTVACTFDFWKRKSPELLEQLPECLGKWIKGGHVTRDSGLETVDNKTRASSVTSIPSVLIIEVDGRPREVEEQLTAVLSCVETFTSDFATAIDEQTVELLWKLRRSCSQAMFQLGPRKLNEDVVVPFDSQMALLEFVEELNADTGLPTPTFGHAADGNFHVHVMYDADDPHVSRTAEHAIKRLMEKVIELGGAISGEHGIGLAKSPFFELQHSESEIQAMRAIKATLDPNNILNPGKLWEPSEPWSFPREDVRMPWDH
ncbi:MAG: FAD-binding oxidoreductase [Puniceicoccaceae bacterium]